MEWTRRVYETVEERRRWTEAVDFSKDLPISPTRARQLLDEMGPEQARMHVKLQMAFGLRP